MKDRKKSKKKKKTRRVLLWHHCHATEDGDYTVTLRWRSFEVRPKKRYRFRCVGGAHLPDGCGFEFRAAGMPNGCPQCTNVYVHRIGKPA